MAIECNGPASVVKLLVGSYTSNAQSQADPDFFDVQVRMVRIWETRTDGYWLYVEQAMAAELAKPYRQRIYNVAPSGDASAVIVRIMELPNAADRVGAWQTPGLFDGDKVESLTERQGSAVTLRWKGDHWDGCTNGKECVSNWKGAAYATSCVSIYADHMETLDRGYNAQDEQVWGSKKGPYVFKRFSG